MDVQAEEDAVRQILKGKSGLRIAEIGCWMGSSTPVFADYGTVYCVDNWTGGTAAEADMNTVKNTDVFAVFRNNLQPIWDKIKVLYMSSADALEIIPDGFLDAVYVDADHTYKYAKQDIYGWAKKVKEGGFIIGHDLDAYYQPWMDEGLESDTHKSVHCWVSKAVHEFCRECGYSVEKINGTRVWLATKI